MKLVKIDFAKDMSDGEMKELKVGDYSFDKILISKVKGNIHAIGALCSHFGVPLSNGALFDGKVVCPAHAARFDAKTGVPESGPIRDSVPNYKVH